MSPGLNRKPIFVLGSLRAFCAVGQRLDRAFVKEIAIVGHAGADATVAVDKKLVKVPVAGLDFGDSVVQMFPSAGFFHPESAYPPLMIVVSWRRRRR